MHCEKLSCTLEEHICIRRQELEYPECIDCKQGKEIARKEGVMMSNYATNQRQETVKKLNDLGFAGDTIEDVMHAWLMERDIEARDWAIKLGISHTCSKRKPMKKKEVKKKRAGAAPQKKTKVPDGDLILTLDLTAYPALYQSIYERALKEVRPVEHQILYDLINAETLSNYAKKAKIGYSTHTW